MTGDFKKTMQSQGGSLCRRNALEVLQVNLGNMCNQRCLHCHVNAGPSGDKIMSRRVIDDIIYFLSAAKGLILDITGGSPELNQDFRYLVEKSNSLVKQIKVRSNLTVIFEPQAEGLPEFFKKSKVKLICSMPCYTKENVDKQRGMGVFDKSVKALKQLNELGYGKDDALEIDLVYNPGGIFLPGNQIDLERDYRKNLKEYGIVFNRLITITNAPINRFREFLEAGGNFDEYMELLIDNFNPDVAGDIMCRGLLSVGPDGIIYDCDFNQALGLSMRDASGRIMEIRNLRPQDIEGKEIIFENHCYCCTAGAGSSCTGALSK